MTHDEETLLKQYLDLDGDAFEEWLRSTRDGSDPGELEYKAAFAEARAWDRGYREGAKACAAWVEAQEDSAPENLVGGVHRRRSNYSLHENMLEGRTR